MMIYCDKNCEKSTKLCTENYKVSTRRKNDEEQFYFLVKKFAEWKDTIRVLQHKKRKFGTVCF